MKPEILKWVRIVVLKTVREKRLSRLDIDALLSAGHLGYVQAKNRFDPDRGVKFKTFAEYRIKGAVLDEVRKMIGDERCKNKRPRAVYDFDFEQVIDDKALVKNLDSHLDIQKFFKDIPLDEREKKILVCRIEGMNLREIGSRFGFSESRASQLLAEIKRRIFPWFKTYLDVNFKLTTYLCPACQHENETATFAIGFDCEKCGADIIIEGGVAQLPAFDEGEPCELASEI